MGETSDIGVLIELIRNVRTIVEICDSSVAPLFYSHMSTYVGDMINRAKSLALFLKEETPHSPDATLIQLIEKYDALSTARAYLTGNRIFVHSGNIGGDRVFHKFEMPDQPQPTGKDIFLSPTDLVMKLIEKYPAFRADIAEATKLFYDEEGKPIYYGKDGEEVKVVTEPIQRAGLVDPFRYPVRVDQMTESQLRGMRVLETLDLVKEVDTTNVIKDKNDTTTGLKNSGMCFYESHGDGASGVFRLYLQHKQELRKAR